MARSDAQHLVKEVTGRLSRVSGDVRGSDITAAFIEAMGGVGGLVSRVVGEIEAAPAGSLTRAKLIETMLRGLKDQPKGVGDISTLDESELQRLLAETASRLAEGEADADGGTPRPPAPAAEAPPATRPAEEVQPRP